MPIKDSYGVFRTAEDGSLWTANLNPPKRQPAMRRARGRVYRFLLSVAFLPRRNVCLGCGKGVASYRDASSWWRNLAAWMAGKVEP